MQILDHPVGNGSANTAADTARVLELFAIAGFPGETAAGPQDELATAISKFQRDVVGLRVADGRIDPGGETMATLLAQARLQVFLAHRVSRHYADARVTQAIGIDMPDVVLGDIQKPHLISAQTIEAVRMLGYCCGLDSLKITEGIRTYEMMASYFLRKITDGNTGIRGESYRHALQILENHNDGNPYANGQVPEEHIQAVADRMRERCEQDKVRVSMHVVSEDEYRALNVIDLGYNSNPLLKETVRARVFARLLDSFHAQNKLARYRFIRTYYPPHHLNKVLTTRFGREIKVENAWHLEIAVAGIPPILS